MMSISPDSPRRILAIVSMTLLAAAPCAAQKAPPPAVVQGRVVDSLVQPIVNADVAVDGTTIAVKTDSYGRFALRDVPPGAHVIAVRKIGYGPIDVAIVTPRDTSLTAVVMTPGAVVLKTIVTRTVGDFGKPARLAYTSRFDGFYERRAFNVGSAKFYTHEDIDRMDVTDFRDILRRIPHLQIWDQAGSSELRFPTCGSDGILIELNGHRISGAVNARDIGLPSGPSAPSSTSGPGTALTSSDPLAELRSLRANEVEAIEAYPTSSTLPVEAMGNACAAIFVWTR
jgi:hypothetical protein